MTVKLSDGRYRVTIPDIPADLLGVMHEVVVTAGESFTIRVSAISYVYTALASADPVFTNATARNAVASLYRYYTSATAYRAKE